MKNLLLFMALVCSATPMAHAQDKKSPPKIVAAKHDIVAVLNFENLAQGDTHWAWLGKGLADLTIGDLSSQGLRVVSREQMQEMTDERRLKKEQNDPRSLASVLQAFYCVHGTYRVARGEVELHAMLLDVRSGKQVHAAKVSGGDKQVLELQKRLAAEIADVLAGNRPGTLDPDKLPRWTDDVAASQLVYQGIDQFDRGDYLTAWGLFRRALRQDAKYADALYWAGRMMYYAQEYHQARVDLHRFVLKHNKHQRVGDAAMEIVNSAQLTAQGPDDVLEALKLACALAPEAEVHNQFGVGRSSTVAVYAGGLGMQILLAQNKPRAAFDFLAEQLADIPREKPLYWIVWEQLFKLKVQHLQNSGELLTMPPPPTLDFIRKTIPPALANDLLRPLEGGQEHPFERRPFPGPGGDSHLSGDIHLRQEFVKLTPEKPTVHFDFTEQPLVPWTVYDYFKLAKDPNPATLMYASSFTRHFSAPPGYYLTALDVEVAYRNDPARKFEAGVLKGSSNENHTMMRFPLDNKGVVKGRIELPRGTRAVPLHLRIHPIPVRQDETTTAAILSWKMTGHLQPVDATSGTIVFQGTNNMFFRIFENGKELGKATETPLRLENLPPGTYTYEYSPWVWGPQAKAQVTVKVEARETVEVALAASVEPRRRAGYSIPWTDRPSLGTPYDVSRLGANLGDKSGRRYGDLFFLEDRTGRWILLWNQRRDLYMLTSADKGETWSPTIKLPPPVNSAHEERSPVMMQDESGRFVLTFSSDRGLRRSTAVYACWSDDLMNFSAPVLITPEPGRPASIVQRSDGTYLAYLYHFEKYFRELVGGNWEAPVAVCTSTDLVHWTRPIELHRAKDPITSFNAIAHGGKIYALSMSIPKRAVEIRTSFDGIDFKDPVKTGMPLMSDLKFRRIGPDLHVLATGGTGACEVWRQDNDTSFVKVRRISGMNTSDYWFGEAYPGAKQLYYFSLPYDHRLANIGVAYVPPTPGMVVTDYHRDLLPESDPRAKVPASDLSARILKRTREK